MFCRCYAYVSSAALQRVRLASADALVPSLARTQILPKFRSVFAGVCRTPKAKRGGGGVTRGLSVLSINLLNLFFKLKGPPDRMSSGGGGTPGVRSEFPSLLRCKQAVVMSAGRAAAFPTASVAFQAAVIPPPPPAGAGGDGAERDVWAALRTPLLRRRGGRSRRGRARPRVHSSSPSGCRGSLCTVQRQKKKKRNKINERVLYFL